MVHQNQNDNLRSIHIDKNTKASFGICIVKGEVSDSELSKVSGVFIKDIVPQSPAYLCGKLKIGDRILTLNNQDVRNASEQTVIDLIKKSGHLINLEIQTFGTNDTKKPNSLIRQLTRKYTAQSENQDSSDKNGNSIAPTSTNVESDEEEEADNSGGRTYSSAGVEIDRASAGNVKLNKAEKTADKETEDEFGYTTNKIKKKYSNLGQVHKTEIVRELNMDLGLALAGHRDRQKMACFVAGVNPEGICVKADLKSGDQILEVNGNVLIDRCHLNASVVFKNLPGGKIVFVILRRKNIQDVLSVKPVQHFPAIVDETEYLFSAYKNVKSVQIHKTGVSLGIMVIEGKHVEVGSGIFISDLQAGSAAEEAGLKVGDLILAINKDVITETSYEMASEILKRAKGVVTLVICSLKSEAAIAAEKAEEEKKKAAAAEPEKPQDPATAVIQLNKKTLIEIKPAKAPLGCVVVGGKNNYVKTGAVITHVHPGGFLGKDNRLQVFDQILEFNSTPLDTTTMTTLKIHQFFNLPYEKVTMMVWRSDPPETESIKIEFLKKAGKEFGLTMAANAKGVTITEITPGSGYVEIESRLQRGDIINKFNGDSLEGLPLEVSYALFRGSTGKVSMDILRPKPAERK